MTPKTDGRMRAFVRPLLLPRSDSPFVNTRAELALGKPSRLDRVLEIALRRRERIGEIGASRLDVGPERNRYRHRFPLPFRRNIRRVFGNGFHCLARLQFSYCRELFDRGQIPAVGLIESLPVEYRLALGYVLLVGYDRFTVLKEQPVRHNALDEEPLQWRRGRYVVARARGDPGLIDAHVARMAKERLDPLAAVGRARRSLGSVG